MKYGVFCNGLQVDKFDTEEEANVEKDKKPTTQEINIPGHPTREVPIKWEVRQIPE